MSKNATLTEKHVRLVGEAARRHGIDIKPISDSDILKNFTVHYLTGELIFWFNDANGSTHAVTERHLTGGLS